MANIKGVEIFAVGKWNGNKITAQILEDIVDSFDKTKSFLRPVLKLGHNEKQELLAQDGLPAAGWVEKVYIHGKKLFADFSDIPVKIAELIKKKAYRKVSVEIFSGLSLEGVKFPHLLGAVALLGADTPAVLSLNDIPTDFNKDGKKGPNFTIDGSLRSMKMTTYTSSINEMGEPDMPKSDNKDTKDQASNQTSETVDNGLTDLVKKQKDELNAQIAKFNEYKKGTDAKLIDLEASKNKAEVEKFTLNLEAKDLSSTSMKPYIEALSSGNKQEFSIGDKKLSTTEVIYELLKLAKEVFKINKTENTVMGENKENKDSYENKNKAILEYMKANNVSYAQGYKDLQKQA